ncbi:MAG: type I-C CRISPR-associated endonuclease Cas1c [Muribaculaceae bacterium]|nr:type I-C CRISPR-associated endonuclease Cas1c [Muribaculaceae bacterium]
MKKLLNTLYVTTSNSYLSKDNQNVVVSSEGKELFRIPIHNIESIITFGYQGASPGVMQLCTQQGVALSFFTPHGRFIARVQGGVKGNILLRTRQYEVMNDESGKGFLASRFIYGKIYNTRAILRRFIRDYSNIREVNEIENTANELKQYCKKVLSLSDLDTIRGIEGTAAASYFNVFPNLMLNQDKTFHFNGRTRRPPRDSVNAMLSFGYSLLANDCASALEGVGLDPAAGMLHSLRPGRNSLALDLMEEMRGYMVDRFVISLVNTKQISSADFKIHTSRDSLSQTSVIFTETGLKKFLSAWQARKKTEFTHPYLQEKIRIGLLPHVQAMLLSRYLRGDIEDYPVFLIK